jgi:anti-sigma regulatory factor (Ser/Thr protein kinase)
MQHESSTGMTPAVARVVLPATPVAARQARQVVAAQCLSWDREVVDTALLLTSELVTNAVIHGHSDVQLEVRTDGARLRVDVADDNSRLPRQKPADHDALDGRGLQIVELLATRWGVHEELLGKTVWFELE